MEQACHIHILHVHDILYHNVNERVVDLYVEGSKRVTLNKMSLSLCVLLLKYCFGHISSKLSDVITPWTFL